MPPSRPPAAIMCRSQSERARRKLPPGWPSSRAKIPSATVYARRQPAVATHDSVVSRKLGCHGLAALRRNSRRVRASRAPSGCLASTIFVVGNVRGLGLLPLQRFPELALGFSSGGSADSLVASVAPALRAMTSAVARSHWPVRGPLPPTRAASLYTADRSVSTTRRSSDHCPPISPFPIPGATLHICDTTHHRPRPCRREKPRRAGVRVLRRPRRRRTPSRHRS